MTEPETGTSSEVYSDAEKSAQDSENKKSFSDYNTDTSASVKLVCNLFLECIEFISFRSYIALIFVI